MEARLPNAVENSRLDARLSANQARECGADGFDVHPRAVLDGGVLRKGAVRNT